MEPLSQELPTVQRARSQGPPPSLAKQTREAAVEFEAYVLKMLLTEMRKTVGEGGLLQSRTLRGYDAMLDDALARRAAEAGSFGLAKQLLRSWGKGG